MTEPLFREIAPVPLDIASCNGSYVIDKRGKRYLDFMMGWCVGNAGWNKKVISDSMKKFSGPTYVAPTYKYSRWEVLAKKLVSLMPQKGYTCFRATGGTEAVELALKISKVYNRRNKFIAFDGAYHGQSLACLGLVGTHEDKFGPYGESYIRLKLGDWEETTQKAVDAINEGDVSAFISEPIICNLGVIVPPVSFFKEVREACSKTDTLFIMDEVATGFGRTGKRFGFEHYDIKPDIVTIAKGFSSGYAPIGATIADARIAESMRFDFSNYSTFGWHPLAVELALANIQYIGTRLIKNSEKMGTVLSDKLSEFCKPEGKGLCIGFDINNPNLESDCRNDGLLISGMGKRAVIFPALDIGKDEIEKAVKIIENNF